MVDGLFTPVLRAGGLGEGRCQVYIISPKYLQNKHEDRLEELGLEATKAIIPFLPNTGCSILMYFPLIVLT